MSLLRMLLIYAVLASGSPSHAVEVCTPLPEPEVTVELSVDIVDPVVGDRVEFSADVRDPKRVPVRNVTIELSGWQTRFVPTNVIVFPGGSEAWPFPDLNIHFFAIRRIAAHAGSAKIVFAVHYEVARGCAEAPAYESRTAASAPLSVEVIAANACRGDCDGDNQVTADEIQRLILGALEGGADDSCAIAHDPDRSVGVDDLLLATTNALRGCPAPRVCGGVLAMTCPGREWCDFPAGTCGFDAAEGICRDHGQVISFCPGIGFDADQAQSLTQVCGCDAVTYPNDCQRVAAGVALAHPGPCDNGG